jgi:hypothetical protein
VKRVDTPLTTGGVVDNQPVDLSQGQILIMKCQTKDIRRHVSDHHQLMHLLQPEILKEKWAKSRKRMRQTYFFKIRLNKME